MKTILSSRKRHYMKRVGTFLIAVALIAGMVGCGGEVVIGSYTLTVDSTFGGTVILSFDVEEEESMGVYPMGVYPWHFDGASYGTSSELEWDFGDGGTSTTTTTPTREYNADRGHTPIYEDGLPVDLKAIPSAGCYFIEWTGDVDTIDDRYDATTTIILDDDYSITANFGYNIPRVAAGGFHTVGVKFDGTAVAAGDNSYGQCDTGNLTDIFQAAAGMYHTVVLIDTGGNGESLVKPLGVYPIDFDGASCGDNSHGQGDVFEWTSMMGVAAGNYHTAGVKSDCTVVAVGDNSSGQCDVNGWYDITQVAAGGAHTVGRQSPDWAVAVGDNSCGQCNTGNWDDIIEIDAGELHTVGLNFYGTVVAVGNNDYGQCNVGTWEDIAQVAAGGNHTVGLKSDGTVVAVGQNDDGQCNVGTWTDIVYIDAGSSHTVGLKSDGTVVAVGRNDDGQCDVSGWNLAFSP